MTKESLAGPARGTGAGPRRRRVVCCAVLASLLTGCGATSAGGAASEPAAATSLVLYTCLSAENIQPVIKAFQGRDGGGHVDLFRAPTGQLNARVAADVRSGGLRADVVWGCDPLTVQALVDQHLVGGWTPSDAQQVPARFRTADYVGAHVLYMVAVHRNSVPAPTSWTDLTGGGYAKLAVPDPALAASALGALGWFAAEPGYGMDFYRALKSKGAVQVGTPDEVTTGVAQGVYDAGITTANSAYAAQSDGSPVGVVWPEPGAVAIYGPIALATHSARSQVAKNFISFAVSTDGQAILGRSGAYPTLPGVAGPAVPDGAPVVTPDWTAIAAHKAAILSEYHLVFGR